MHTHKGQLILDGGDAPSIQEGYDQAEFVRLAAKYMHHDGYSCSDENCLICEGIGTILNGQDQLAEAEYEKNREHSEDLMGSAPF